MVIQTKILELRTSMVKILGAVGATILIMVAASGTALA